MNDSNNHISKLFQIKLYIWILAIIWIVVLTVSALWNITKEHEFTAETALTFARTTLAKDILYRRWNAQHGGVYVWETDSVPPNPFLSHIPERDITTPSGKILTLINPAYMTREVNEMAEKESGVYGHITSLNPIRPQNAPDDWERKALERFEKGEKEVSSLEMMRNEEYLRLMGPMITEEPCLKCHAVQGYKVGDIRGGISVSVPMKPLRNATSKHIDQIYLAHAILLILGLSGIFSAGWGFLQGEKVRIKIAEEREDLIVSMQDAANHIKTLEGMVPICSICKKIRDDKGFWNNVEEYVSAHTEAEFSHGICPECYEKNYPDFLDDDIDKKNHGERSD